MLKQSTALTVRMQTDQSSLSMSFGNITVTDSETQDSVTVQGVTRKAIEREIRSYVRSKVWSHEEANRSAEIDWLAELVTDAQRSIDAIREKVEEAAK